MKNNNKIITLSAIFAAASLSLILFIILPLWQGIKKDSADLIAAKDNQVTLFAQSKEMEAFKKNYNIYKPNLDKIDNMFIDPANPVDLIKFLEGTAYNSQISSQISLLPSANSSQKAEQNFVNFQFSSKGEFSRILDFSKKIEAGPYLIEISSLTIQNSDTKDASASPSRKVDAAFVIKAFANK